MTGKSPWPSQHELASLSGQDLPFHLKSAWVPKLTDTMNFTAHPNQQLVIAVPSSPAISIPRQGSGSRQLTGDRPRCVVRSLFNPVPAAEREEKRFHPFRAPGNNHTPDPIVFSNCDQPNMFLTTLPGPGDTGVLKGREGRLTVTAHPGIL